jgi:tetratricopeptide (TPR) repeat protein
MKPKITKESLARAKPVTAQEIEAVLLGWLRGRLSAGELRETLWSLALFYQRVQQWDLAEAVVEIVLRQSGGVEESARCLLVLGQLAECRHEFAEAARRYRAGLELGPEAREIEYLLHNNLGYCLYLQGSLVEAEAHLRRAVELDPGRSNAWCNLGLVLEAQGDFSASVWAYTEALKAEPSGKRAAMCAERLLAAHPELRVQFAAALERSAGGFESSGIASRGRRTLH